MSENKACNCAHCTQVPSWRVRLAACLVRLAPFGHPAPRDEIFCMLLFLVDSLVHGLYAHCSANIGSLCWSEVVEKASWTWPFFWHFIQNWQFSPTLLDHEIFIDQFDFSSACSLRIKEPCRKKKSSINNYPLGQGESPKGANLTRQHANLTWHDGNQNMYWAFQIGCTRRVYGKKSLFDK